MPVIFNSTLSVPLRNRRALKTFLHERAKEAGFKLDRLEFNFIGDEELLNMNREYLNHDYYTDILTFDFSDADNVLHGSIFISVDRVKENAKAYNELPERELHRVIFHGVLHLMGHDDRSSKNKALMRLAEDQWLGTYFDAA